MFKTMDSVAKLSGIKLKGGCCAVIMLRFLASRGEFDPGPVTKFDCSELLCNNVLLKYKRDRESF